MGVTVVADIGSNWRAAPKEPLEAGWKRWRELIHTCAGVGVDVVKGQFLRRTVYPEGSREAALVADYEWPQEWLPRLAEECRAAGVEWMCTVFEPQHVPLIDPHVKRHKVASFELRHRALLKAVAATGKPVVLSTGASTEDDIGEAVHAAGITERVIMLHCVSAYPAALDTMNLRVLAAWQDVGWGLRIPYGLSDHTAPDTAVAAVVAVALGAGLVECHVTLEHDQQSPDASFSRDPFQLVAYVDAIRQAEEALGSGLKRTQPEEWSHYRFNPKTGKRGTRDG